MVIDRKISPQINEIKKAVMIRASETKLKNGIPVHYINAGTHDLVKIELLFPAGMWQQTGPLVASGASAMLQQGTSKHSSKEIAEMVDYYGAFLETNITHDFASVSIYSVNKHLASVLPMVEEIIKDSVFGSSEWDVYLGNKKQSFIVSNKKVGVVSQKKFAELLFGTNHPYGYNVQAEDYGKVKREESLRFYKQAYTATGTVIVASGKVSDMTLKLIEKHFGSLGAGTESLNSKEAEIRSAKGIHYIEKSDALQSSIRMGKMLFTKPHPDYPGMLVLNTVFGGYFGSRLMANIREDKGYTYGIGSALVSFSHGGYFTLSTEVGAEVTNDAIKEIYFELNRIQTEKIQESELALVRNYMLGTFLRSIDGPFALADRFKGIYFSGLGYEYYDRYVETVRSITAEKLMELANKYWKKEELIELVVGKK
jgi:predicted Zn-dependent peptidase